MDEKKNIQESALKVNEGVEKPDQINAAAIERLKARKHELLPARTYINGLTTNNLRRKLLPPACLSPVKQPDSASLVCLVRAKALLSRH